MEERFYTRPTGKLKSVHPSSFGSRDYPTKDKDSVYSLQSYENDYSQYPLGKLSPTQLAYISKFVASVTGSNDVSIDPNIRSIHWIGTWNCPDSDTTVSATILQPHITACNISLAGVTYGTAQMYANSLYSESMSLKPSIMSNTKYCRAMGKMSIPFVDSLIEMNYVNLQKVNYTNIVLSQTHLIFCIAQGQKIYECKLTHASCKIIDESGPPYMNVSHPTSTGHNFAFRSESLRDGNGTGPSITVHTSGTMQYQGSPNSISEVASCFNKCIRHVMESRYNNRFLRSLCIIRDLDIP